MNIIIVGAGIGGVPAAYAIKSEFGEKAKVILVSDNDYFQFVPSNPMIALGWRSFADVTFELAPYLDERGIEFMPKTLRAVHPDKNEIELESNVFLKYDYLVLATGAQGAFDDIPGLNPAQGRAHTVIRARQAEQAHDAYQRFASQPGPVVVGAMQGASILGPVYELAFLIDVDLRRRNIRGRVPITVVTPEPFPGHLGLGAKDHTRQLLEQALDAAHIECICNAETFGIEAGKVQISQYMDTGKERQKRELPSAYTVYWPRFQGIAALRNGGGLSDDHGLVRVDEFLRHPEHNNIYAAGLCAAHEPLEKTPVPIGAPQSVYSIQREVDTIAKNILAASRGRPLSSHVAQRTHWINDLGDTGAIRLSRPHVPLRDVNWLKQGVWVHSAKSDFEKYFLNHIKLKPSSATRSLESEVATVVANLKAARVEKAAAADSKPYYKQMSIPLALETFEELQAMAEVSGHNPNQLATELLSAALRDAKAYVSEEFLKEMAKAKQKIAEASRPESKPGAQYEGGAP